MNQEKVLDHNFCKKTIHVSRFDNLAFKILKLFIIFFIHKHIQFIIQQSKLTIHLNLQ